MTTFEELLRIWPRIFVLYPAYLQVSNLLENAFPLVKIVRENAQTYTQAYISERRSLGLSTNGYQVIELITQFHGQHVEVLAVLFRKEPSFWHSLNRELSGYTLTELPDSRLPIRCIETKLLSPKFYLI